MGLHEYSESQNSEANTSQMKNSKNGYSKWFYVINYLFFIVAILSLFTDRNNFYSHLFRWIIVVYAILDISAFVIAAIKRMRGK